jgi:hypothetical protein
VNFPHSEKQLQHCDSAHATIRKGMLLAAMTAELRTPRRKKRVGRHDPRASFATLKPAHYFRLIGIDAIDESGASSRECN